MTSIQLQGDLTLMMCCSSTSTEQIFLMRSCYLLLDCFQKMFKVWYPGILLNSVLQLLSQKQDLLRKEICSRREGALRYEDVLEATVPHYNNLNY